MASKRTKTLAFCFDGTGNEPADVGGFAEDESVSNILKLHVLMGGDFNVIPALVPIPGGTQQSFYYNGIGTRESKLRLPLLGRLYNAGRSRLNMLAAPSWGDARRILEEAREDFDAHHAPGAKLAIFGYSRGAALARKFASTVLADQEDCSIAFVGVFDTVAAMDGVHRQGEKVSSDVLFENGTLHPRIERAVHLLAIDEDRVAFTPTLMNKDAENPQRILEVWFPGVHGDVGGGYWRDGLSDNALGFMIRECGMALGDAIAIADGTADVRALHDGKARLPGLEADDIEVHPMPHGTLHAHAGAAALLDQAPRNICVNDRDRPSPTDLPLVHGSAAERFASVADYRPPALRGLRFKLLPSSGGRALEVSGVAGLRAMGAAG